MNLFIFGKGYAANAVIEALKKENPDISISYTSRSPDGIFFDGTSPVDAPLDSVTHLLISIPPQEGQDVVLTHHAETLLSLKNLQWVGYLSSTSVYGDHQGAWVDENTPPRPLSDHGKIRLSIENQWRNLFKKGEFSGHIFRLSGIYGPHRSALDRVLSNSPLICKKDHVTSRIHVDDIAQALIKSMKNPCGGTYNLSDDLPASSEDVMRYAAHLLNRPLPPTIPFEEANLSPFARSFYEENKRVKNNLLKKTFGITLSYPTYKEGLLQTLSQSSEPTLANPAFPAEAQKTTNP